MTDIPEDGPQEFDEKTKLLWESYTEVLDATKHQDDKVGRLVGAIAFLTAAALALAGLESTTLIRSQFLVSPVALPLGVITLAAFLICVLFSVLLLISSIGVPLRQPGVVKSQRPGRGTLNPKFSTIYFYEIALAPLEDWRRRWERNSREELEIERFNSLVGETHNLAVRTTFKYDRSGEGMALFALALLSFALTVVFVAIAATIPSASPDGVSLTFAHRALIGFVFAAFSGVQLLTAMRYEYQAVDETLSSELRPNVAKRLAAQRWFAFLVPLALLAVLVPAPLNACTSLVIATLGIACMASYLRATTTIAADVDGEDSNVTPEEAAFRVKKKAHGRRKRLLGRTVTLTLTAALTGAALIGGNQVGYVYQLAVAAGAAVALILPGLLRPTLSLHDRRWDHKARLSVGSTAAS